MSKVTVMATFRIDDNGISIEKLKDSLVCESFRSLIVLDDDNDVYVNDAEYKALCKEYKDIKAKKEEYFKSKTEKDAKK